MKVLIPYETETVHKIVTFVDLFRLVAGNFAKKNTNTARKFIQLYLVLKYGLPQDWLVKSHYNKLKVVKEVLPKVQQLLVMKLKAADKKAEAPQYNENKVKDFLRHVCQIFHDHELCP